MTIDMGAAGVIVLGLIGLELIRLITRQIFQKFTTSDYVSKKECDECARKNDSELSGMKAEIVAIKQILLIMASRAGIREDDLKKLIG